MEDVTGVHSREDQRRARWLLLSLPLSILAGVFIELYVTFLVTRSLAPDVLGQVATRPAAFAALIALVASPMHVVVFLASGWRHLRAVLTGAEPPAPPARTRWRRIGSYLL